MKLMVRSLPWTVRDDRLASLFERFGPMSECKVIMDRNDPTKSRGFAFITFKNEQDARDAQRDMDQYEIDGRRINVQFASAPGGSRGHQSSSHSGGRSHYDEDRGGSSRYSDDRGGSSRYSDDRGGSSRYSDDRGGSSRHPDDRGGSSRYADDRGGSSRNADDRGGSRRYSDDRGGSSRYSDDRGGGSSSSRYSSSRHDDDRGSRRDHHQRERSPPRERDRRQKPTVADAIDPSNTNNRIYITGLPENVTETEIAQHFGQIGIVARKKQKRGYPDQWPYKVSIYLDQNGKPKGDAAVTYEDQNAAMSAPNFFHNTKFKGNTITVQMAHK